MTEQPTQERIKEFWEWCGLKYELVDKQVCGYLTKIHTWSIGSERLEGYLDIDLNNLFKYAVPKIKWDLMDDDYGQAITIYQCDKRWGCYIGDFHNSFVANDPALALFWALWQVKERIR